MILVDSARQTHVIDDFGVGTIWITLKTQSQMVRFLFIIVAKIEETTVNLPK